MASDRLQLMLEAERRGILPPDKTAALTEARRRGLVQGNNGDLAQRLKRENPGEYDPESPEFQQKYGATSGMSGLDKFMAGAGKSVIDLGRGIKQAAVEGGEKLGILGDGHSYRLRAEADEVNALDAELMNTGAGMAGNVVGSVASLALPGAGIARGAQAMNLGRTAGIARAISAPSTIGQSIGSGAALGMLQPVGNDESRLMNTAIGGVGGGVGGAAAAGIGRVIRPTARPDATRELLSNEATQRGIPLGAGDLTGSKPIQILESVLANTPGSASREAALSQAKQVAYNRSVAEAMGEQGVERITPDVLRAARKRLGDEFNRMSAGRTVRLGNELLDAIVDVDTATAPVRGVLDTGRVDELVENMLNLASRGQVTGDVAQQIRTAVTNEVNDAARQGNTALANALRRMRDGIDDSIRGGLSQDEQAAWDVARQQWGNMRTVERAMSTNANATSGDITGDALLGALKQSGTQLSRQENELKTLGQIGRTFVKPQVPDSGTAQRTMITNMLATGGAGAIGGGALGADPLQSGAAGAALPLAAMVAQPALRSQLMSRYLSEGLAPNVDPRTLRLAQALRSLSAPGGASLLLQEGQ